MKNSKGRASPAVHLGERDGLYLFRYLFKLKRFRKLIVDVEKKCFITTFISLRMSSSFSGWSIDEIVGRLTKAEVLACLPAGWIRATDARQWRALEGAIHGLSDEMKGVIYEAGCRKGHLLEEEGKTGRKRKSGSGSTRRVCRRVGEVGEGMLRFRLIEFGC
jgi:hypothetical protein